MEWREFCDYLEQYVDHFDIRDCIQLNCKVTAAESVADGWQVSGVRQNFSNGHRFHPPHHRIEEGAFNEVFTHLVVCTGLHQNPFIPDIPGLVEFSGPT